MLSQIVLMAFLGATPSRVGNPSMQNLASKITQLRQAGQDPLLGMSVVYSQSADHFYAGVQETRDILSIDGNGNVSRLRTNDMRDPETPAGKWSGTVPRTELEAFVKRLGAGGIDLPSGGGSSPLPSEPYELLEVKIAGVEGEVGRRGVSPHNQRCGFDDLRPFLERWMEACKKPLWSLSLEMIEPHVSGKHLQATLRFSNHGTQALKIPHPASPTKDEAIHFTLFHYLPQVAQPGFSPLPLEIRQEPIHLTPKNQVEWITIGPDGWWDLALNEELSREIPVGSNLFFEYRSHLPISKGKPESFQGTATSSPYKL